MKNLVKSLVFILFVSVLGGIAAPALAYSPTLSANYQSGGSNNLQISISNAQPFNQVSLNTRQSSLLWTVISNIGQTDGSGYFNQVISMPSDGSNSPLQLYATVGGQQTPTISVYPGSGSCTYNCGNPSGFSLSQSSVNLNVGQTVYVTGNTSNYTYNSVYVSSNSNSGVATVSASGNQVTIYGNSAGTTTIGVCATSSNWGCTSLYVTVSGNCYNNGSYNCNAGNITLSQTSLSLTQGQNSTVSIYNNNSYSNTYYVSSNSNASVASVSVSGSTLNVYGNSTGNTTITICQNSTSGCATLYVTVSGNSNTTPSLSRSTVSLISGQGSTVDIYNFTVTDITSGRLNQTVSNTNIVNAYLTSSLNGQMAVINMLGQQAGNTTINVCGNYSSNCVSLYVTVTGSGSVSNISLSQTSLNLNVGQSSSVNIYGNGNYYVSSNSNSAIVSASISGSTLNLYASQSGSSTVSVCQNNGNGCATIYVTVSGSNNCSITGSGCGSLYFNTTTLPVMVLGQYYSYQLQAFGGNAPYTFSLTSGNLPNGISLSSSGLLSGVPNNGSTVNFTIRVNDNYGRTTDANFSIGGNFTGGGLQYSGGGSVLGSSIYPNGRLFSEYGTVYIVYKNTKTAFANSQAFTGLGFKFSNVQEIPNSGLAKSTYTIRTSAAAHPWGSWIKSGLTVYFVHEAGLIPVPNWNTFASNGGLDYLVVNANTYDFRLPMLSVMTMDDSRLK